MQQKHKEPCTEHLPSARLNSTFFQDYFSEWFNNLVETDNILFAKEEMGLERLSHLPKITKLLSQKVISFLTDMIQIENTDYLTPERLLIIQLGVQGKLPYLLKLPTFRIQ